MRKIAAVLGAVLFLSGCAGAEAEPETALITYAISTNGLGANPNILTFTTSAGVQQLTDISIPFVQSFPMQKGEEFALTAIRTRETNLRMRCLVLDENRAVLAEVQSNPGDLSVSCSGVF